MRMKLLRVGASYKSSGISALDFKEMPSSLCFFVQLKGSPRTQYAQFRFLISFMS
jgi:hypothetical protein